MADSTAGQRRTQAAREAFARQFQTPEAKSEHYRALAQKANDGRLVLSSDQADTLRQAYALLLAIGPKLEKPTNHTEPDESAA